MMHEKYLAVRDAVQHQARLRVRHLGQWLTLCPHILAWRGEEPYLVGYAIGTVAGWVSLRLRDLDYVRTEAGPSLPVNATPPVPPDSDLVIMRSARRMSWARAG
jgi:hypothetical protein